MKGLLGNVTRRRYLFAAGLVLLTVLAGASLLPSRGIAVSSTRVVKEVKSEDFGAWAYRATLEQDGWTSVWVDRKERTPAGLRAFIAASREMGQTLSAMRGKPFHAVITFNRPLPPTEFEQMTTDTGIPLDRITGYTMRGVSTNSKWWVGGAPQRGTLIDESTVNGALEDLHRHDQGATILGVVYFVASLTPDEYQHLSRDERVAVIDVTQDVVRDRLSKVKEVDPSKVSFAVGSPYYQIEQFGADALQ